MRGFTRDFGLDTARGKTDITSIHKFGSNHAVGTSLVPLVKGGIMQMPTIATALEILSDDDVKDKAGGIGALTVTIEGLNLSWAEISETITLNGTTAVALSNTYIRINRMWIASSGSYASPVLSSHTSEITLRTSGGGAVWCIMNSEASFGLGQSQQGVYTVPTGKTAYIKLKKVTTEASKPTTVFFFVRENADDVSTPYSGVMRVKEVDHGIEGTVTADFVYPSGPFIGPCDIGFMAKVPSGTAEVGIDFNLLLENT